MNKEQTESYVGSKHQQWAGHQGQTCAEHIGCEKERTRIEYTNRNVTAITKRIVTVMNEYILLSKPAPLSPADYYYI